MTTVAKWPWAVNAVRHACDWSKVRPIFNFITLLYRTVRLLNKMRIIILVELYSYLFWSDGTGSNAKIERSDLSGNSRTVLVSWAQGLVSPTTLVVDFNSQKLYWLDSAAQKIGHVNFDGSEPFTQTISLLSQVSAMTIYRVRTENILNSIKFNLGPILSLPTTRTGRTIGPVCVRVWTITFELNKLWPKYLAC